MLDVRANKISSWLHFIDGKFTMENNGKISRKLFVTKSNPMKIEQEQHTVTKTNRRIG